MTTQGHTPGPWVAREQTHKDGSSLGWIIEHSNGRIGWSSYATAQPNEGEERPYPIGAANAVLIAAAPDMLAALKDARATIANYWPMSTPEAEPEKSTIAVLNNIDAAIAKAEGTP